MASIEYLFEFTQLVFKLSKSLISVSIYQPTWTRMWTKARCSLPAIGMLPDWYQFSILLQHNLSMIGKRLTIVICPEQKWMSHTWYNSFGKYAQKLARLAQTFESLYYFPKELLFSPTEKKNKKKQQQLNVKQTNEQKITTMTSFN